MNSYITNRVLYVLGAICIALAVADLLHERHGDFAIENIPLFWCASGFVTYIVVIFMAKALRLFVVRPEDYYGREATDAEDESAAGTEARDV